MLFGDHYPDQEPNKVMFYLKCPYIIKSFWFYALQYVSQSFFSFTVLEHHISYTVVFHVFILCFKPSPFSVFVS